MVREVRPFARAMSLYSERRSPSSVTCALVSRGTPIAMRLSYAKGCRHSSVLPFPALALLRLAGLLLRLGALKRGLLDDRLGDQEVRHVVLAEVRHRLPGL